MGTQIHEITGQLILTHNCSDSACKEKDSKTVITEDESGTQQCAGKRGRE